MLEHLSRAQVEHRLDRRLRVYLAPKVLVIDEFGVWPCDRVAATALFTLVSARYERGSIVLTSNKNFAEWADVLGDAVIATAILDPAAASQPRPQHPRRELPPAREEARRSDLQPTLPAGGAADRSPRLTPGWVSF